MSQIPSQVRGQRASAYLRSAGAWVLERDRAIGSCSGSREAGRALRGRGYEVLDESDSALHVMVSELFYASR